MPERMFRASLGPMPETPMRIWNSSFSRRSGKPKELEEVFPHMGMGMQDYGLLQVGSS